MELGLDTFFPTLFLIYSIITMRENFFYLSVGSLRVVGLWYFLLPSSLPVSGLDPPLCCLTCFLSRVCDVTSKGWLGSIEDKAIAQGFIAD